MDFLRACYSSEWHLFRDNLDKTVKGRFYFVPSTTPGFPAPHFLWSRVWGGNDLAEQGLGESLTVRHRWNNGKPPFGVIPLTLIPSSSCVGLSGLAAAPATTPLRAGIDSRCWTLAGLPLPPWSAPLVTAYTIPVATPVDGEWTDSPMTAPPGEAMAIAGALSLLYLLLSPQEDPPGAVPGKYIPYIGEDGHLYLKPPSGPTLDLSKTVGSLSLTAGQVPRWNVVTETLEAGRIIDLDGAPVEVSDGLAADFVQTPNAAAPDAPPAGFTAWFTNETGVPSTKDSGGVVAALLTQTIADGLYDPLGEADDAVADHVAEADPHDQYALLAGRSGGQDMDGGTDASDRLLLGSTVHATKGGIGIKDDDALDFPDGDPGFPPPAGRTQLFFDGGVPYVKDEDDNVTPVGGGSAPNVDLVATADPSGASEVVLTGLSGYSTYRIVAWGLVSSVGGGAGLRLRTSTDDGSTFNTGASDYNTGSGGQDYFDLGLLMPDGSSSSNTSSLEANLFGPGNTGRYQHIGWWVFVGTLPQMKVGVRQLTTAYDTIKLYPASGTFSGHIRVYGYQ